jgi:cytochrome P450
MRFIKEPLEFLTENSGLYGRDLFHFKAGGQHIYFVGDPEVIGDILVKNQSSFVKSRGTQLLKRVVGEGLLTSEGEEHARQRRLVQPLFYPDRIKKSYAGVMVDAAARRAIGSIDNNNSSTGSPWKDGATVDIHKEMTRIALAAVSRALLGSEVSEQELDEVGSALEVLLGYFNTLRTPFAGLIERVPVLPANRAMADAKKKLDAIIYRMIEQHKQDDKKLASSSGGGSGEKREDLMSLLLFADAAAAEQDKGDDDDVVVDHDGTASSSSSSSSKMMADALKVRDQAMTIFLAGHETTANALAWTFYLVAKHPAVEDRLLAELESVLGGTGKGSPRLPAAQDIPRLEYAEKVFAESLRLYPPAWAIGRKVVTPNYHIGQYVLPANSVVVMSQYITHRDPRFFADPDSFVPERWTPEFKSSIPRFAYFPFGGGPRSCIGEPFAWAEAVLVMATILPRWKMVPLSSSEPALYPTVTLRPRDGIPMRLAARHGSRRRSG